MFTQNKDQKIAKLEALILKMGHVIRSLDEGPFQYEYWAFAANENRPEYVPALDEINRFPIKQESSPSILESDDLIKVIIIIEEGKVQTLHATSDLQYVVVDVDTESKDPILIGNVNTPDSVDTDLSLRRIHIALENVEDFENHPWK